MSLRLPFNGSYALTQPFGANPAAYAQFGMKGHNGHDYGLPTGTPVLAATDGVALVLSDPGGFGLYIQVNGVEYKTVYAHLSRYSITNGQRVKAGQVIGYSGNTGNSSGPHLHFGVKPLNPDLKNGYYGAVDPAPLINGGSDMYQGKTAEQWAKEAADATAIATVREDYLNKIGYAEGSGQGAIEADDVARIIAGIDERNKTIVALKAQVDALSKPAKKLPKGLYEVD